MHALCVIKTRSGFDLWGMHQQRCGIDELGFDLAHQLLGEIHATRLKGLSIPTLKELGFNVEIGNWRGVYGAADITPAQRKELIELVVKASRSKSWAESLAKNSWTSAVMTGDEFGDFVDREFASLRATMVKAGMI